jgi:hypothetical protein
LGILGWKAVGRAWKSSNNRFLFSSMVVRIAFPKKTGRRKIRTRKEQKNKTKLNKKQSINNKTNQNNPKQTIIIFTIRFQQKVSRFSVLSPDLFGNKRRINDHVIE